ncbi:MAG: hypothetical protein U0074_05620 [Kouleothrix sp.]
MFDYVTEAAATDYVTEPVVRVEQLTKDFTTGETSFRALDDVSLEIHRGENGGDYGAIRKRQEHADDDHRPASIAPPAAATTRMVRISQPSRLNKRIRATPKLALFRINLLPRLSH